MKGSYIAAVLLLLAIGCVAGEPAEPRVVMVEVTATPDVNATVDARVARGVQTAMAEIPTATRAPTVTPVPTSTPAPTATPIPTATPRPTPTRTPRPTATKRPTSTPWPTPRPTATPSIAEWSDRLEPWVVLIGTSDGSVGTGFFIQDPRNVRWYVVTNAHVVGSNQYVTVSWNYPGIPASEPLGDIALM